MTGKHFLHRFQRNLTRSIPVSSTSYYYCSSCYCSLCCCECYMKCSECSLEYSLEYSSNCVCLRRCPRSPYVNGVGSPFSMTNGCCSGSLIHSLHPEMKIYQDSFVWVFRGKIWEVRWGVIFDRYRKVGTKSIHFHSLYQQFEAAIVNY